MSSGHYPGNVAMHFTEPLEREQYPPSPPVWGYKGRRSKWRHLADRFFRSLRRTHLSSRSDAWVKSVLTEQEQQVFFAQCLADQRHGAGVGKRSFQLTDSAMVGRAGVLHDIGKIDCELNTPGRAVATIAKQVFPLTSTHWMQKRWDAVIDTNELHLPARSWREKFAAYWLHPWTGQRLLRRLGSDPAVSQWALHHHFRYLPHDSIFTLDQAKVLWASDHD